MNPLWPFARRERFEIHGELLAIVVRQKIPRRVPAGRDAQTVKHHAYREVCVDPTISQPRCLGNWRRGCSQLSGAGEWCVLNGNDPGAKRSLIPWSNHVDS